MHQDNQEFFEVNQLNLKSVEGRKLNLPLQIKFRSVLYLGNHYIIYQQFLELSNRIQQIKQKQLP
jgi:hypothetical protein